VIEGAPAGVARIDTDFSIIDANPRFSALLASDRESLVGKPVTRYLPGGEGRRFVERLQALKDGAVDVVDSDSEAVRTDGTSLWLHWSTTVVRNAAGESEYFIAMFEDTTARHEAEAAAAANLGLMQRLNRIKTEFLQGVSHEFKTALIGIQGFSELMRDADELEVGDVRTFAADIYSAAERLDRIVTEMIDLDRVESGRANLHLAPIDLNDLVRRGVERLGMNLELHRVELDLAPALPLVSGDEAKLSEVIGALLEDAMHSSAEDTHVRIATVATNRSVDVSVKGDGVGAAADFDNRLFGQDDLYANNPIRKVVGTGLRLGIARQVVEMHGGRLSVLRPVGEGSEYRFTIPVAWDRQGAAAGTGTPAPVA
jgi:PAS domain S-box-containing protein